jgi:membrane protease YdiL (CAAX protease family)
VTAPEFQQAPGPSRATALFEVVLCSGFPTQIVVGTLLSLAGLGSADGRVTFEYLVALSLLDTTVLTGIIFARLRAAGESARVLFLGDRPIRPEAAAGLPLALMALILAVVVLSAVRELAPWLRTFERNPFQDLVRTPAQTAIFAVVVVVAGGVREEIQRAFLLSRFERSLGGTTTGVVVTSAAFGAGHFLQGVDAAIATAALGAFWAIVYLRRRSIVAPLVSHSGFNLIQLTQFFVMR